MAGGLLPACREQTASSPGVDRGPLRVEFERLPEDAARDGVLQIIDFRGRWVLRTLTGLLETDRSGGVRPFTIAALGPVHDLVLNRKGEAFILGQNAERWKLLRSRAEGASWEEIPLPPWTDPPGILHLVRTDEGVALQEPFGFWERRAAEWEEFRFQGAFLEMWAGARWLTGRELWLVVAGGLASPARAYRVSLDQTPRRWARESGPGGKADRMSCLREWGNASVVACLSRESDQGTQSEIFGLRDGSWRRLLAPVPGRIVDWVPGWALFASGIRAVESPEQGAWTGGDEELVRFAYPSDFLSGLSHRSAKGGGTEWLVSLDGGGEHLVRLPPGKVPSVRVRRVRSPR
ncbi:MAG: hypothetical protein IT285_12185 [Bdellovibrionales bacterium]|nr:hypothetical protein [Bdellovibrionales bacterium]